MEIDLRPIVEEIVSQADDFLAGAGNRSRARAGISELLTLDYFGLTPAQRTNVIADVMAVLDAEDFFETEYVGNPFEDDDTSEV
jgi:hypothetical protein